MKLSILKVILWPRQTELPPRVIRFEDNIINVITGESGTGKSTISDIIDYSLGSAKCAIPVGLIRNVTEWFGMHIKIQNTELIIARRNPGEQQVTGDFFWTEGLELEVPPHVTKNARVEDFKHRMNQTAHLSYLEMSSEDEVGYGGRPSFRDMAAFNFQPQHIVANPYTLFFKSDTTKHREKLRSIFPLVLGAVDADTLAMQRELKDISREYDRAKRELETRLSAASAWEAEVESYYLQAQAFGLLPASNSSSGSWSLDNYLVELKQVPDRVRELDLPDIKEGTNSAAASELTALVEEEDRLAQVIGTSRRRLSKLDQLSSSIGEYNQTLAEQEDRMVGTSWFAKHVAEKHKCPVCNSNPEKEGSHLSQLLRLADELKSMTTTVAQAPAKLDRDVAELREELRTSEARISKVRQKRKYLEGQSEEFAAQRQRVRQIYLFVGRIEQALDNVATSRNVGELQQRVNELKEKVQILSNKLDPRSQKKRLDAAIQSVSQRIYDFAKELELEHASENVRLNISELSLEFTSRSGRKDFLWELGSGQNWVGYHIACLLALHDHFMKSKLSPVPRFLVIDQPSQVYFPDAWPSIDEAPSKAEQIERSSDILGVHRIFSSLSKFLHEAPIPFQILVTEHAGSLTWSDIDNVHVVGNWRKGQDEWLIPRSWIEADDNLTE